MRRDIKYWKNYVDQLKASRVNFDSLYEEIRKYFAPYDPRFNSLPNPGEKRGADVYTSDPMTALDTFTSNTYSQLFPLTEDFFSLEVENEDRARIRSVQDWLNAAERAIYRAWRRSNFRFGTYGAHKNLCTYGTGAMFVDYAGDGNFRFQARPIQEVFVSENEKEEADTIIRSFWFSVRQIKAAWPDAQGEKLKQKADTNLEERMEVIHIVCPKERDEETFNPKHEFISLYLLPEDNVYLNLYGGYFRGFEINPYVISRLDKESSSPYGYSRTAIALADVKSRNKLNELKLKALAKEVDPPLLVHHKSIMARLRMGPGNVNYINSDDPARAIVPLESRRRWDVTNNEDERLKAQTDDLFYARNFNVPFRQRGPNISAREIEEATASTSRIALPIVSRLEQEVLAACVMKTFWHLYADGFIPPAPPEVAGSVLNVRATGPLALNQDLNKVSNSERLLTWIQQLANTPIGSEMAMAIRGDVLVRNVAKTMDIWDDVIRSEEEIEAQKQQQQQMAGLQQGAELAKTGAEAYSKVGGAGGMAGIAQLLGGGGIPGGV